MTAAAAIPAAVAQKALGGSKLSSMQILLLTAMTLLGFYLCFTEIRRLNTEVASIRDRLVDSSAKATGEAASQASSATQVAGAVPAPVGGCAVVAQKAAQQQYEDDDEDDDEEDASFMDEGLRQMLEQLQRAAMPPPHHAPVATVEEVEEEKEGEEEKEKEGAAVSPPAPAPTEEETLMAKSKAEIEELLKQAGIPYKKSDSKAKLAHSLLLGSNATVETE